MNTTILIVDDEKNLRAGLAEALQSPNRRIFLAENGFQAEEIIKNNAVDLVLSDLQMPSMNGLELLQKVQVFSPTTLFIIMTAYGTVDNAVKAMKAGAYDYLTKPINLDELDMLLARALKNRELESENVYLKEQLEKRFGMENMIGHSRVMENVFELIRQISPSNATVLITGKSGTGKELVARAIHQQSPRKNKPFIPIHCASLSPSLLESELFGHEKGSFTGAIAQKKGKFEIADGGTIFLDEVNEIPLAMQVKLLRFLEMREFERVGGNKPIQVDVRLLAASNSDLQALVREGEMREDLYFRLNVVRVELPPLMNRRDDIPLLVHTFIKEFSRVNRTDITGIAPEALRILQTYDWPGNVRELRNCIESMVVLSKNSILGEDDIPIEIRRRQTDIPVLSEPDSFSVKKMEKELIRGAIAKASGNKKNAAELLGISRRTLYRKMEEYGLKEKGSNGVKE